MRCLVLAVLLSQAWGQVTQRPNVLFILADDMGQWAARYYFTECLCMFFKLSESEIV